MFELIETSSQPPRPRPHRITPAERIEAAAQADCCVKWLKANGFEVLYVQHGPRNPRIIILSGPLCESLEGAVRRFERVGHVETRYWVAVRFGCEVRWTDERGAQ